MAAALALAYRRSALGIDPAIAERVMIEGTRIDGGAVDVTIMFIDIVGLHDARRRRHSGGDRLRPQ